jgi:hypothetical protein
MVLLRVHNSSEMSERPDVLDDGPELHGWVGANYGWSLLKFVSAIVRLWIAKYGAYIVCCRAARRRIGEDCFQMATALSGSPLHGLGVFTNRPLRKGEIIGFVSGEGARMNDACPPETTEIEKSITAAYGGHYEERGTYERLCVWRDEYNSRARIERDVSVRYVSICGVVFMETTRDAPRGTELLRLYGHRYWIGKWLPTPGNMINHGLQFSKRAEYLAGLPVLRMAVEDSSDYGRRLFAPYHELLALIYPD